MITTRHTVGPAAAAARLRALRLAAALVATVALAPAAIAHGMPPPLSDGSASSASAGQYGEAARQQSTGVRCPCNAGLPIGTSGAAYVPPTHPHVQRPGPGGPVGTLPAPPAAPPVASAEVAPSDGFDWIDAAAGAGVVAVLGGLVLVAGRARSRPLPG